MPERAPTPERLAELYDPGGCGLDPDEAMLSRARRRPDVEWVRGDAASASRDRLTGGKVLGLRTPSEAIRGAPP